MKDIKCPRCDRKVKLHECVCYEKGRKRIMLDFPCYHYSSLVYNVPTSMDNNTIIKHFNSISKEYFEKTYYLFHHGDVYLD